MSAQSNLKVGFLGAGQMATALASGLVRSFTTSDAIVASDPSAQARQHFEAATGCRCVASNAEAAEFADVVVIAVKPHFAESAARDIAGGSDALVVSIVAGIRLERLEQWLGEAARVVRVMPNTPCLIGRGASAVAVGTHATESDGACVTEMMSTVGEAVAVPEWQLDAITGLSGSGPAYVYQMIEALSDGGVRAGLPRAIATRFAAQTVQGAAQMVLETDEHPARLKDAVASPGGTTIAGLHEMERGGVRAALMNAVLAAAERSRQLGE